ncbi:MAG TPA: methionine aminotransferase [Chitinophagaceae bacterium]|nr:methionine aminotransferase [Chitinophagaceae bacterium]HAN40278.1 methionine aminotransferase [Chitinophagaceae bacterium]
MYSKLPQVGTTIFTVMSQLAATHNAVNLGQGFPDFPMSAELIACVTKAMQDGANQYTHMNGLPLLREQLCQKMEHLYGTPLHANDHITITPGGTYAIYTAITALLQPGDEVIVFEPCYDSYLPNIIINGGIPVTIALNANDYSIPWDEVNDKITTKTKLIIINSPHNPTGAVLQASDLQQLEAIVAQKGIFVLSDEVYEHLIFDGIAHQSVCRYPNLLQHSMAVFSFGKTYHCTGWKLGYCISTNEQWMQEFRKVHQFNVFSCNTPMQAGLAAYLQHPDAYLTLGTQMQAHRDYFQQLMQSTPLQALPSYGSYFQCYSYAHLSDMPDKEAAVYLTEQYGVATIPVSAFYANGTDNKVLRFCFAKQFATLERAVARLNDLQF